MKKFLFVLIGFLLAVPLFASALSVYVVPQGGTGAGTFSSSQLLYGAGTNPIKSVATTTASCSGTASCSSFTVIGATPVTITGGGAYPFTPNTNFGVAVSATSTPIWDTAGIFASSTSQFVTLTVNGNTTLQGSLQLNGLSGGTGNAYLCYQGGNVSLGTSGCTSNPIDTFAWPFTAQSWGNSTTSALSFNGFISSASSTLSYLAGTAAGSFIAVDATGKIIATSTPTGGTGSGAVSIPVQLATTGALPANTYAGGVLTEVGTGALTVDSTAAVVGNRVLVKNEVAQTNNGIYSVTAAGSGIAAYVLTRVSDYNSSSNVIPGEATYVIGGATLNDDWWALTTVAPITVGGGGSGSNLTYIETNATAGGVTSLAGTINQITASASTGAVTLSFPTLTIFPSNASSTLFSTTYASSTNYFGANLSSCTGTNALTWSAGFFGCTAQPQGTVTSVGGSGVISSSGGATPNITVTGGTNGQVLGWLSGVPTWTASSSIAAGTGISISTSGAVTTITNTGAAFAYPFSTLAFGSLSTAATSTALYPAGGLITGTSTIGALVASSSITNQQVKSALVLNSATGLEGAYGGASACSTNNWVTALSAVGGTTCGTIGANGLTLSMFPTIAANTIIGNLTGGTATPTAFATSSLFAGTTGQNAYFGSTGGLIGTSTISINTTTGQVTFKDFATGYSGIVSPLKALSLQTGTTTGWTASTSNPYIPTSVAPFAGTIEDAKCVTDASFLGIEVDINGTPITPKYFVASTTKGLITFTSGNTFSSGDTISFKAGTTTTATATTISCTLRTIETT